MVSMKNYLPRALLAAIALFFIVTAPALAQTAPAEAGGTDLPSAASELLSAPANENTAMPQPEAALNLLPDSPAPRYGLDILRAFGMFILVLGLLFLTLKLIGRFGRFRAGKGRANIFAMRGILPLDNRKYLAAVEVEGRLLVLGVTQDRVSPLAHWPLPQEAESANAGAKDFAFHLREDEELPDISISDEQKGGRK
jgi:flagellar biogenesis protein FliO